MLHRILEGKSFNILGLVPKSRTFLALYPLQRNNAGGSMKKIGTLLIRVADVVMKMCGRQLVGPGSSFGC